MPQVYLAVRSFAEGDAYLCSHWYARVANKAYPADVSATETDFGSHFTVACYDDDPAVSSAQVQTAFRILKFHQNFSMPFQGVMRSENSCVFISVLQQQPARVGCEIEKGCLPWMQLMVPKEEVIQDLKEQGIDVHDVDAQLRTIAIGLIKAAHAQVH